MNNIGEQHRHLLVLSRLGGLRESRTALAAELGRRARLRAAGPTKQPRRGPSTATIPAGVHASIVSPACSVMSVISSGNRPAYPGAGAAVAGAGCCWRRWCWCRWRRCAETSRLAAPQTSPRPLISTPSSRRCDVGRHRNIPFLAESFQGIYECARNLAHSSIQRSALPSAAMPDGRPCRSLLRRARDGDHVRDRSSGRPLCDLADNVADL